MDQIEDLIVDINLKEKAKGLETLLSPIVAQELLAHIADPNDSNYEKCLKANKAMYLHNGNVENCNVFPSFEVLLSKMYFDLVPNNRIEHYNAILQMSCHLALNPTEDTFLKLADNLNLVKLNVDMGEKGFIESMFDFIKKFDTDAIGWQIFKTDKNKRKKLLTEIRSDRASLCIAAGYVSACLETNNTSENQISISQDKMIEIATDVVKVFPEPIALFKTVLENLVNSDFNLTENSRANFVWDIALMFCAGRNKIENSKLYFVTSDKAIIKTAVDNNSGCYVITFEEYMDYLNT